MSPAEELRFHLGAAHRSLAEPQTRLCIPQPQHFLPPPTSRSTSPGVTEGHFHLRAELFLQIKGATQFRFPSESIELGPGEILIVPPRVYHAETITSDAGEFRNVVLYADERRLSCHLAEAGPVGPKVAYPEHLGSPGCGRIASWLEEAVKVSRDLGTAVAADLVRSVLGLTLRMLDLPVQGGSEPLPVVQCRQMIHEELGNAALSVASLARRLGFNADYLSHLFRKVQGQTLTSHIEELRLVRAAELLTQTSLSCKEVAWASGYSNQSYFIRCFRQRWGASPLEYRSRP